MAKKQKKARKKLTWTPIKKPDGVQFKHEKFFNIDKDEELVIHRSLKVK